jgi:hypothetical protein
VIDALLSEGRLLTPVPNEARFSAYSIVLVFVSIMPVGGGGIQTCYLDGLECIIGSLAGAKLGMTSITSTVSRERRTLIHPGLSREMCLLGIPLQGRRRTRVYGERSLHIDFIKFLI